MTSIARPDFSHYVVHFAKDGPPISAVKWPEDTAAISPLTANERLLQILRDRTIRATRMPWTNRRAVCFTECTWHSLLSHALQYSRYGIGFQKEFLFSQDGGPAIYMTPELLEKQKEHVPEGTQPFHPQLYTVLTPFMPFYASPEYKNRYWSGKNPIDYTHEREWRVLHDLHFPLEKVSFVIVDTYEDMAKAPAEFKDAIGRENWLLMSNYEKVEEFWPVHNMPE
ncbi:MAG: abortive infection system antitoxin AbiGi family protein [Anaerolineales bacterium]